MLKDLNFTSITNYDDVQKIVELVLEVQRKHHSERIKNGIRMKKERNKNNFGGKTNEKN